MLKTIIISAVVLAIVGFASVLLFVSMTNENMLHRLPENTNLKPAAMPINTPNESAEPLIISKDEVLSLSIETAYSDFFEESDLKCRRKNSSGNRSPCKVTIVLERNGDAKKIVVFNDFDPEKKESLSETTVWKAVASKNQFDDLATFIVESEMFKNWDARVDLYTANSTIAVKYPKGERRMLSNVDKTATAYLPKVEAFIKLDREIRWEKVEAESFPKPAKVDKS